MAENSHLYPSGRSNTLRHVRANEELNYDKYVQLTRLVKGTFGVLTRNLHNDKYSRKFYRTVVSELIGEKVWFPFDLFSCFWLRARLILLDIDPDHG